MPSIGEKNGMFDWSPDPTLEENDEKSSSSAEGYLILQLVINKQKITHHHINPQMDDDLHDSRSNKSLVLGVDVAENECIEDDFTFGSRSSRSRSQH